MEERLPDFHVRFREHEEWKFNLGLLVLLHEAEYNASVEQQFVIWFFGVKVLQLFACTKELEIIFRLSSLNDR